MAKENFSQENEGKPLSKKVWEKIESSNVEPVPKWRWQLKELLNWSTFLISVLLGSISVSIILLELFSADWNLYTNVTDSFTEYLFGILPYFWILFLIVMVVIAYYRFFNTKKGYRFSGLRVLVFSLLISFAVGFFLYFTNVSFWVYDMTDQYVPKLPIYNVHKYEVWQKAQKGFLAGQVINFLDDKRLELRGFDDNIWQVNCAEAKMHNMEKVRLGSLIKILGEKMKGNVFKAYELHPWKLNIFDNFVKPKVRLRPVK